MCHFDLILESCKKIPIRILQGCLYIYYIKFETIFTQKLLVKFTINYKETASNTINTKFWSRKTEIEFSFKKYFNNLYLQLQKLFFTAQYFLAFWVVIFSNSCTKKAKAFFKVQYESFNIFWLVIIFSLLVCHLNG